MKADMQAVPKWLIHVSVASILALAGLYAAYLLVERNVSRSLTGRMEMSDNTPPPGELFYFEHWAGYAVPSAIVASSIGDYDDLEFAQAYFRGRLDRAGRQTYRENWIRDRTRLPPEFVLGDQPISQVEIEHDFSKREIENQTPRYFRKLDDEDRYEEISYASTEGEGAYILVRYYGFSFDGHEPSKSFFAVEQFVERKVEYIYSGDGERPEEVATYLRSEGFRKQVGDPARQD